MTEKHPPIAETPRGGDDPGGASRESGDRGEWFEGPDPVTGEAGLRFGCTQCGNCCSGPPGYVHLSEDEAGAMAARLGLSIDSFKATYCVQTFMGLSLKEKPSAFGQDCIFLDRETIPGRAICGVYEERPAQCRAWPFWPSLLRSRADWARQKRMCPGLDKGELHSPAKIRLVRATIEGQMDPSR